MSLVSHQFQRLPPIYRRSSTHLHRLLARPQGTRLLSVRATEGQPEFYPAQTTKEEWLKVDEKVNTYPSQRTFKAIGIAGTQSEEFVSNVIQAVEEAGNQAVLVKDQVSRRPSKDGNYVSVSVNKVNVESGEQVYGIYEAIRSQCGKQLKFII